MRCNDYLAFKKGVDCLCDLPSMDDMALQEAQAFQTLGKHWFASVWAENDPVKRGTVREQVKNRVNEGLGEHGISMNRGWQDYDPVIRMAGKPDTYNQLAGVAGAQPDGGKQMAAEFMAWAKGDLPFEDLSRELKAMAVITHIAEVGRGYSAALESQLYPLMEEISESASVEEAKEGWSQLTDRFDPALKYKDDIRQEFTPRV